MPLRDAAATAGRLAWSVLIVGWPLVIAATMIVPQLWRQARADGVPQPGADRKAPRRRPERRRRVLLGLTATAAGLLVLVIVLVVLPMVLVPAGAITDDKELYKARNDLRGILVQVQVLAGGLVATGLVFTARTLNLNRSGQVTERFTRAVDQLGQREPDKVDVRLGGIYALERIARDSAADLPTVVEVLCAHVRQYSPWPPRLPGQGRADLTSDQLSELPDLQTRAPDLQAVLTVLGRLPDIHPNRSGRAGAANPLRRILTGTDLRRANLRGAHLKGADLRGAHLEGAQLAGAHLEDADLEGAYLQDADLYGAYLEGAYLGYTHMEGAYLGSARMEGNHLRGARLDGAALTAAHLEGADLYVVHLERANLRGTYMEEAFLNAAHLEGADLRGARLDGADLDEAHLEGAIADAETVWPSDFDWAAVGVRLEEEDVDYGEDEEDEEDEERR
jgi:hypothetical protein